MPKHPSIPRLLKQLNKPGYDRDAVVRGLALALDLITPLGLVPSVGPLLEVATDLIWMPAAEVIVAEVEKVIAKKKHLVSSEQVKGPACEEARLRELLGNLLAVIHGDGGHYVAAHGLEKACDEAARQVLCLRHPFNGTAGEPAQGASKC